MAVVPHFLREKKHETLENETSITIITLDIANTIMSSVTDSLVLMLYTAYINDLEDQLENEKVPEYILVQTKSQLPSMDNEIYNSTPEQKSSSGNIRESSAARILRRSISDLTQTSACRKENDSQATKQSYSNSHSLNDSGCTYALELPRLTRKTSTKSNKSRSKSRDQKIMTNKSAEESKRKKKRRSKDWTQKSNNYSKISEKTMTKQYMFCERKKSTGFSFFDFLFPRVRQQKQTGRILKQRVFSVIKRRSG